MSDLIANGSISYKLEKNKTQVNIEKRIFNMGKRREIFWIKMKNQFGMEYKLPALTLQELEKLMEAVKELDEHVQKPTK